MKNRLLQYIYTLLIVICTTGCVDDAIYNSEVIGDGVADVSVNVSFESFVPSLMSRTNGNAIHDINNMMVLIYDENDNDEESKLIYSEYFSIDDMTNWEINQYGNTSMPGEISSDKYGDNPHQAEPTTPKASFKFRSLPYGKYHIYVVANMGKLSADKITSPSILKNIALNWEKDNIAANNQMFGYFTLADNKTSEGFNAPLIFINKPQVNIHSWIKRAASKVTVAVDGSQLNDGVSVWIKSIQIKDIPKQCFLGRNNRADANNLYPDGGIIKVSDTEGAESDEAANIVTNAKDFNYYPRDIEHPHANDAPSLFFYENMQGDGQLKTQLWPDQENKNEPKFPDGNNPESKGYKDNMRYGTYIEVIGYYKNNDGEGSIIYRFMLGKNITTNYDAQRNHHFKLTLKLKNNANDNDWHIVYDQEPEILAIVPYYISYLYNQTMTYPIKIVGGELISLKAEIPSDDPGYTGSDPNVNKRYVNQTSWAPKEGEVTQEDIAAAKLKGGTNVYWSGEVNNPGPWNGFLSLRKTTVAQFGVWPAWKENGDKDETYGPNQPVTYTYNKTYWDENDRGGREYNVTTGTHSDPDGDYTITRTAPGEYLAELPLYTRARVMVSQTGYSGNNPFAAYNREAMVKVTAVVRDHNGENHTVVKRLPIIQSRRVLNPKAIWRKADSNESFHVKLKILPYQQAQKFEDLKSDGPWYAVVEVGKDWIQIEPTDGVSYLNPDGSISGIGDPYDENNPGRAIDFTYRPKSTTTNPRGGIIKVYYNNNTCVHTIFVRQGYDPVSFYNSNVMWHTYNLRTGGVNGTEALEAPDPEVEGAYFRQFNREYPIDAINNTFDEFFKNGMSRDFQIAGTTYTKKWSEITTKETDWGTFNNIKGYSGIECRLPTQHDFEEIIGTSSNPIVSTVYGFGVLYADGANDTLEDINLVYGATPEDHNSGRGMRGVILCDENTGTQIFLPIAASGYGRFKQFSSMDRYNRLPKDWGGVIQYANRYTWYPSTPNTLGVGAYTVQYHPLFYDLWMSEGTYYWLADGMALDINFYTLNIAIGAADESDLGLVWGPGSAWAGGTDPSGSDAVHIRLVHDREQEHYNIE